MVPSYSMIKFIKLHNVKRLNLIKNHQFFKYTYILFRYFKSNINIKSMNQ